MFVKRYFNILLFLLMSACSSTIIAPQPQPGAMIDQEGMRIGQTAKGVHVSAKLAEATVRPSPAQQNYASFWIEVNNQRNVMLPVAHSDFMLIDDQGRQYQTADPQTLVEMLTDAVPYLIPYPYVGFYYLEDRVRAEVDTQFASESHYFASRRPEYLATDALPDGDIAPATSVAGTIYFPVELRTMNGFHLRYHVGALPGQKSVTVSLPFVVEKK